VPEMTRGFDRYGQPLSSRSATAVACYIIGIDRLLAAEAGAQEALQQALAIDEGFALAHAALALIRQGQGATETARQSATEAVTYAPGLSRRERQHVEVITTWVGGNASLALALAREHLSEYPRDAVVLSLGEFLLTRSGRQDRHQEALAHLTELAPSYGDDWYFLGLYSFIHHELDRFEEARRLAERSLTLNPRTGLAAHSLAHVFYETNAHATGCDFLEDWMADYNPAAPMHCHLAWHLALHALALGHYAKVQALYDQALRPGVAHGRTVMYDAASLLWRCQLYGCTQGRLPWNEVCKLAIRAAEHPGMAFVDANAALALAADGDEAALVRMCDDLRQLEAQGHPTAGTVVLPLVQGAAAFARGDYNDAIRWFEPIIEPLVRIGGSNAQREVFVDTLLEAYLRAGEYAKAELWLCQRVARRPSARDLFWLGRAQAGRGQVEDARLSLSEACRHWSTADAEGAEQIAMRNMQNRVERTELS
jgi:tetratricopeptide (TPR) repeat protein